MNQNNNAATTTAKMPAQAPNDQPRPISIQTAEQHIQQQMCNQVQQPNDGTTDHNQGIHEFLLFLSLQNSGKPWGV